jgi:uncharacterized protein YjaG (DUF416 family)
MNYTDYITLLKIQTNSQPRLQQLKFAVTICKKLYFGYKNFVEVYQWGDADLLMDAINICERSITNSSDLDQIKELIPKIDLITPHMDDFGGNEIGSYALNASASVYETLEFIIDHDKTHIFNIATYYTDTIDFKIQEERELTELEIENHPLMIEAWNFIIDQTKNGT